MNEKEWNSLSDFEKWLAIMDENDRFTDVYHDAIMEEGGEEAHRDTVILQDRQDDINVIGEITS